MRFSLRPANLHSNGFSHNLSKLVTSVLEITSAKTRNISPLTPITKLFMISSVLPPATVFASAASAPQTLTVMTPEQYTHWIEAGRLSKLPLTCSEMARLATHIDPIDSSLAYQITESSLSVLDSLTNDDRLTAPLGADVFMQLSSPDFAKKATAPNHRKVLGELVDYIETLYNPEARTRARVTTDPPLDSSCRLFAKPPVEAESPADFAQTIRSGVAATAGRNYPASFLSDPPDLSNSLRDDSFVSHIVDGTYVIDTTGEEVPTPTAKKA